MYAILAMTLTILRDFSICNEARQAWAIEAALLPGLAMACGRTDDPGREEASQSITEPDQFAISDIPRENKSLNGQTLLESPVSASALLTSARV